MKEAKSPNDVPQGHHYAIIIYKHQRIHHEGDERSRTNPGHGYPAYDEDVQINEHYVTTDKQEWEDKIVELTEKQRSSPYWTEKFSAFEVSGTANVKTAIEVVVNKD